MSLKLVNGNLVQTPTVANYQEVRMSSIGRRLVKNMGGQIESSGNYGQLNLKHRDPDGHVATIENPRHIKN